MANRRSPITHAFHPRKYHLRRSSSSSRSRRFQSSPEFGLGRPVLVPLHTNLKRRTSRRTLSEKVKDEPMPANESGSKRKRVLSINENAHAGGRSTRGSGRLKRLRLARYHAESDGEASGMDVDMNSSARWSSSGSEDDSVASGSDDDEQHRESTDDYLICTASAKELNRLRKEHLVRLYAVAGLDDDDETCTKTGIINAIIDARDDLADLPPSSPRGASSDEQDHGIIEDEDIPSPTPAGRSRYTNGLRRRATVADTPGAFSRPNKGGRSYSMGNLTNSPAESNAVGSGSNTNGESVSSPRNRKPVRALPTPSLRTSFPPSVSSPPATRLRSRKTSATSSSTSLSAPLSSASGSSPMNGITFPGLTVTRATAAIARSHSKAKGRQVLVGESVTEEKKERDRNAALLALAEESDLTEIETEVEAETNLNPSPRRLRSKDKERELITIKGKENIDVKQTASSDRGGSEGDDGDDEADQLATPTRSRARSSRPRPRISAEEVERTPLVRRLRPRTRLGDSPPSPSPAEDGDDEQEEEQIAEEEENEEEPSIHVEPRKLRNGKIVGDDIEMANEDVEIEDDAVEEDTEPSVEGEEEDEDGLEGDEDEGEDGDDAMVEVDVDLTIATSKTLVRLRRDRLVSLCQNRSLEAIGTKPQLAETLLQWRDRVTEASSPSSAGTVTGRPPDTVKGHRKGSQPGTPILFRSQRVHIDEPLTPVPVEASVGEPELELDLESLGLDDREIPPDKLQKLEKIGSGGFKDVFIGKFKNRKIAISEFRGQLNAMDIKELKLLGGFDHPNIVRFLGVSVPENPKNTKESSVMIVSELCSNGDLFDYIRTVAAPSYNKVISIMLDIALGLEYLHLRKPSVIHRDCKSSNILITAKGVAKIADFGLAKVKQSTRSMVRSLVGTVNWQAPELWHAHPKYNHKVDVFSCAMVFWEMLQWHQKEKRFPWEHMNEHAIYEAVGTKKQRPSTAGLKKQWSPAIVELMERMWAHQPDDRPTMSEVVAALREMKT
ncbi:unnamed protein product [Mycena citricolor]|uniref:Protein kinase domain-containing protein n=1 Tax=Mycena citricolor TaxID=2018698 RepID=A0AAD2HJU9_9AGAR|nr:unnamed protein product [Mycena citricolor]